MTHSAFNKQRAQTTVARSRQLRREDEQSPLHTQNVYRDPDEGRITLDAFERKYKSPVQAPAPVEQPSRWAAFKEKTKEVFTQIKFGMAERWTAFTQQMSNGVSALKEKTTSFFTSLKEKCNNWRKEEKRKGPENDTEKMKDGYYVVPTIEDEQTTDYYACRVIAAHLNNKPPVQPPVRKLYVIQADHLQPREFKEPGRPIPGRRFALEQ